MEPEKKPQKNRTDLAILAHGTMLAGVLQIQKGYIKLIILLGWDCGALALERARLEFTWEFTSILAPYSSKARVSYTREIV